MKYKLLFLGFLGLTVGMFFLPKPNLNSEIFAAISGVASFLFGLLASFTIMDRHGRIEKITENGSGERGELDFMADLLKEFPKEKRQPIVMAMDRYLMAGLDYSTKDFYRTEKEFDYLTEIIRQLPAKTKKDDAVYAQLLSSLEKVQQTRKSTIALFEDKLPKSEWFILYFLIFLIYLSLLFLHPNSILAITIIFGLAAVIAYLLVVAMMFDDLKWRQEDKIFEPFEKTFEDLKLPRYYPSDALAHRRIKAIKQLPVGAQYRVGDTPDYPDLSTRKIETVVVRG
ncbi:DUF4239 domain-containing protein [Candidatus Microgenomates bacterium]|nr:DUF4239 domain-containing protein [Candidatus Microgenomates bacterium]